jgi:hypothetical protein
MELFLTLVLIFIIGLGASFIGSFVGGAGLVSVPFLMFLGLPGEKAIATTMAGIAAMNMSSLEEFIGKGYIRWNFVPLLLFFSLIGSYIGAQVLILVDKTLLTPFIAILILILLPVLLLDHTVGVRTTKVSPFRSALGYVSYFFVAALTGFSGVGTGLLSYYIDIYLFGFDFLEANATNKIPWLAISITAFVVFAFHGLVSYLFALILAGGMFIGGYVGAWAAIHKGNAWMKLVFALLAIFSAVKLLFI